MKKSMQAVHGLPCEGGASMKEASPSLNSLFECLSNVSARERWRVGGRGGAQVPVEVCDHMHAGRLHGNGLRHALLCRVGAHVSKDLPR